MTTHSDPFGVDFFPVPPRPTSLDTIPLPADATDTTGWRYNGTDWQRDFTGPTFTATGTPQPCYCTRHCYDHDDTTTVGQVTITGTQFADGNTHRVIDRALLLRGTGAADACALAAALLNAADHLQAHSATEAHQ